MGDRVSLALLGCGDVAQRDYLPEMHRLAGRAELVAVCGRTPERARRRSPRSYAIPAAYDDYATDAGRERRRRRRQPDADPAPHRDDPGRAGARASTSTPKNRSRPRWRRRALRDEAAGAD